jgi:tRNA uridine 5-carboxymethylaminomethyl modification enzyme
MAGNVDLSSNVGAPLAQLLKRPEITIEQLAPVLRELAPEIFLREKTESREPLADSPETLLARTLPAFRAQAVSKRPSHLPIGVREELKSVETEIKYEGYLLQQERAIERLKKAEQRNIPEWFDYAAVSGLSREMQEKLLRVRPRTIGHASRIPGVTPAAVSLINVFIEIQGRQRPSACGNPE